jgi:transglutaminase-like putative cysteine protease
MNIRRRVAILAMSLLLFELAAQAIAPVLAPGGERFMTVSVGAGILLGALWIWSGHLLALTTLLTAPCLSVLLLLWPRGATPTGSTAGLIVESGGQPEIALSTAIALAISCFALAVCCGRLLAEYRLPWPVLALLSSAFLVRADVARSYEDNFPLFLLAALLLIGCVHAPRLRAWYGSLPTLCLSAILIGICWQLPAVHAPWPGRLTDPLTSLGHRDGTPSGGQSLSLTGPFQPSDRPVMSVVTDRPELHPYWQSAIFDRYDGHEWTISGSARLRPLPVAPLIPLSAPPSMIVGLTVQVLEPTQEVFTSGVPLGASLPSIGLYAHASPRPLRLQAAQQLTTGVVYQTVSALDGSQPDTRADLEAYLQLPTEPARVRTLALRLAGTARSPAGSILAIERYLRDSGRFTYDIKAGSPADGDAVDNFLFTTRRGYCSQFASTLVVLSRELGIPARLVSGYSTGSSFRGTFTVRERDAHSWAEVYLPRIGWLALDPTPGFGAYPGLSGRQSALLPAPEPRRFPQPAPRQSGPIPTPRPASPPAQPAGRSGRHAAGFDQSRALIVVTSAALLLLAALTLYAYRPRSLAALYRSMIRRAPRSTRLQPGDTPLEYAERFHRRDHEYGDVRLVANLYARQVYAGIGPSRAELQAARRAWRRLHWRWIVAGIRFADARGRNAEEGTMGQNFIL